MDSPPPEDPYEVLSVSKDVDSDDVKKIYRKLVLKFHPDKVQDESKKAAATDQFHKIQQAYEILVDPERRGKYDARVRLAELRKDVMEDRQRSGHAHTDRSSHVGSTVRHETPRTATAAYEFKTSNGARAATFETRGPTRMTEERRPNQAYAESYTAEVRTPSVHHDDYYSKPRKTSPRVLRRSETDTPRVSSTKENEKNSRAERARTSDRERKRDREVKYAHVEAEEIYAYEEPYQKSERARAYEREIEREQIKEETRRSRARADEDTLHDYDRQYNTAKEYQRKANTAFDPEYRPSTTRTSSAKDPAHIRRSPEARPNVVRRSSARRTDSDSSRRANRKESERERGRQGSMPEIVEEPKRPDLNPSYSSPADLDAMLGSGHMPRQPQRSYSERTEVPHEAVPAPGLRRSETTPIYTTSGSRGTIPIHNGKPRSGEPLQDSGYSSNPSSPEDYPYATTSGGHSAPKVIKHHYPSGGDDNYEFSNGRRTERVEPSTSRRKRSPSPVRERERERDREYRPRPQVRTTQYRYPSSTTVEPPNSAPSSVHPADLPQERPKFRRSDAYHGRSSYNSTSRGEYTTQSVPQSSNRGLFGESGMGTTYTTSPTEYREPASAPVAQSTKRSGAETMAGFAKGVSFSKRITPEDIRGGVPMGSKARGTSRPYIGSRRETVH
ncbi:MAG: hypothetical protein M1820_006272 [Bogoriella megaspora]|nr:MAG: hypothetical protein M1820_006272 [Bogoriella megaspora]